MKSRKLAQRQHLIYISSVVGLDACTENIEAAREHLSLDPELQERLSYQCCTVEEVPAENSSVVIFVNCSMLRTWMGLAMMLWWQVK